MIPTLLLRLAFAMSLCPAVVLAGCNLYDTADCDVCPSGAVPGKYTHTPCKCGLQALPARTGKLCKGDEVVDPACCKKDGTEATKAMCHCGGEGQASQSCLTNQYCHAKTDDIQCHNYKRCKVRDGSGPAQDDGETCQCGSRSVDNGWGWTCVESESKVSSAKICKGSADTVQDEKCICATGSSVLMTNISYTDLCRAGQKCNTAATVPSPKCSWPVCTEGQAPSKGKRCECKDGDDSTHCDYGEVCKGGTCRCKATKGTACEYPEVEADATCPVSSCKHDEEGPATVKIVGECYQGQGDSYNYFQTLSKNGDGRITITRKAYTRDKITDKSCNEKKIVQTSVYHYKSNGCNDMRRKLVFVDSALSDGRRQTANAFVFACLCILATFLA